PLVRYISEKKLDPILLINTSNTYFDGISKALTESLKEKSIKVLREIVTPKLQDFRALLTRAKQRSAKALVIFLIEGQNSAFLKQYRQMALRVKLLAADLTADSELIKMPFLAEGVVFLRYKYGSASFINKFKKRWGKEPLLGAPFAYEAGKILTKAVKKCGIKPTKVRDCLTKLKFNGINGSLWFNKEGYIVRSAPISTLYTVKEGKFIKFSAVK
ncbi:MAG: hypothetical protein D6780_07200, partial [Candidatus Dadabacteria bacterium]